MTSQHPITPPPELFKQWEDDILNERDNVDHVLDCAWRNGFQAGADQELQTPTDNELAELYRKSYYECENRQGDAAQVFALRAVLARWGK